MGAAFVGSALIGLACGTSSNTSELDSPDASLETDAGASDAGSRVDPTSALFDPDRVLSVDIRIGDADWDALSAQDRDLGDIFGPGCLDAPHESPFTFFSADVAIDGTVVANVGVRKKGFVGSLDAEKPSLKIKFDAVVSGLEHRGLERMTLNNAKQDPSYVRQCLGYAMFAEAGVAAPRCNFARVSVNGRDLGIYVHVESIDRRFLRRHFDDDTGDLYEGTLSDFRPEWVRTFEKKTNEDDLDRSALDAVVVAAASSDEALEAALASVIDLDAFITFMATEAFVAHWDGYSGNTNNFYVYRDPKSANFHFIPWGLDGIFTVGPKRENEPRSVLAHGMLARRIYLHSALRARYLARLGELMDRAWNAQALVAEADRMASLVEDGISDDERASFTEAVRIAKEFLRTRRTSIDDELARGEPEWTAPLRTTPCMEQIGQIAATFSTTMGTLENRRPFESGTGTLELRLDGMTPEVRAVGSEAGMNSDSANGGVGLVINVVGALGDGSFVAAHAAAPANMMHVGAIIPLELGFRGVLGVLVRVAHAGDEPEIVGFLLGATLELDAFDQSVGGKIEGRITGPIMKWGLL